MSTNTQSQGVTNNSSSTNIFEVLGSRLIAVPVALFILVAIGAFLRLFQLGAEGFWHDEVTMMNIVVGPWSGIEAQIDNGRPALFQVLGYIWTRIFGESESGARLLSATAGIISIVIMYQLSLEWFNKRIAFVATIFFVFSGFLVFQSQNFRYYSVYVLMTLLSYLFYYRALQSGKLKHFVPYVLFSALTFYGHSHGMFVLFSQGLYGLYYHFLLWRAKSDDLMKIGPRWVISQFAIIALIAYGLLQVLGGTSGEGNLAPTWISHPSPFAPIRTFVRFYFHWPTYFALVSFAAAGWFFVSMMLIQLRANGLGKWGRSIRQLPTEAASYTKEFHRPTALVLFWLGGSIITPFIVSYIMEPIFVDRYLLAAAPALYLLTAIVLYNIRHVIPEIAIVGAILLIQVRGLYIYYEDPFNDQWPQNAGYVMANSQPGDVIVITSNEPARRAQVRESFEWYYEGDLPVCEYLDYGWEPQHADILQEVQDCVAGYDRVWITSLDWNEQEFNFANIEGTFTEQIENPWELVEVQRWYRTILYLFELPGDGGDIIAQLSTLNIHND